MARPRKFPLIWMRRPRMTGTPPGPPVLRLADAALSADEGDVLGVAVVRDGSTADAVGCTLSATGGTATGGVDYEGLPAEVAFAPGEAVAIVPVALLEDADGDEGPETIELALSDPTGGAVLGTPSAMTITINDVEAPPPPAPGALRLSASSYSADRGDTATITVLRSGGADGAVAATLAASGGTATPGTDYDAGALPALVEFADGQSSRTVSIPTVEDPEASGDVTLELELSDPTGGATIGEPAEATLTIRPAGTTPEVGEALTFDAGSGPILSSSSTSFNGSTSCAGRPSVFGAGSSPISVAGWAVLDELPASGTTRTIYAETSTTTTVGDRIVVDVNDAGLLRCLIRNSTGGISTAVSGSAVTPGQPFHFAGIWDGGKTLVYLDGVAGTAGNSFTPGTIAPNQVWVGARNVGPSTERFWSGRLQDVAAFDAALSAGEVAELRGGGTPPDPAGLDAALAAKVRAWWALDNPHGTAKRAVLLGSTKYPLNAGNTALGQGEPIRATGRYAVVADAATSVDGWAAPSHAASPTLERFPLALTPQAAATGLQRSATVGAGAAAAHAVGIRVRQAVSSSGTARGLLSLEAADGSYLDVSLDPAGRPCYTVAGAGGAGAVTVTCPAPLYGRAKINRALTVDSPSGTRTRCQLELDTLDPIEIQGRHEVLGVGAPFDGMRDVWRLDEATGAANFTLDAAFPGPGEDTNPADGWLIPTGEYQYNISNYQSDPPETSIRYRLRPASLVVVRDGDTVTFRQGGHLLGVVEVADLPPAPTGEVVATLGRPEDGRYAAPDELPTRAEFLPGAPDAAALAALEWRLATVVEAGGDDYAGLAAWLRVHQYPGVALRDMPHVPVRIQLCDPDGVPLLGPETSTGYTPGLMRGEFGALHPSGHDIDSETDYQVWITAWSPPRWPDGTARTPSLLHHGPVATLRRRPWPRTLYLDPAGGSDSAEGTSEATAVASFATANGRSTPGTRVLLRRGHDYGAATIGVAVAGPTLYGAYGEGDPPRFAAIRGSSGSTHVGYHDLEARSSHQNVWIGNPVPSAPRGLTFAGILISTDESTPPSGSAYGHGIDFQSVDGQVMAECVAFLGVTESGGSGTYLYRYTCYAPSATHMISLRDMRFDRRLEETNHLCRFMGGQAWELYGVTSDPPGAGHGYPASIAPRWLVRTFVADRCRTSRWLLAAAGGLDGQAGQTRFRVARCEHLGLNLISGGGPASVTQCYTTGDVLANNDGHEPDWHAAQHCQAAGNRVRAASIAGTWAHVAGSSGPWRNVVTSSADSGIALTAPAVAAVDLGGGWVAVRAEGPGYGGTGRVMLRMESSDDDGATWTPLAGSDSPEWSGRLAEGEHRIRAVVTDQGGAGTPAEGAAVTLAVAAPDAG